MSPPPRRLGSRRNSNRTGRKSRALTGKIIVFVFTPKAITGARQVVCSGPHDQIMDYPGGRRFQGALEEMHARDKSVDPVNVAAGLGFKGSTWKTLETSCADELYFHFLDASTAAFGLNNHVYLKKQP